MKRSGLDLTYLLTKGKENVQEWILKFCALSCYNAKKTNRNEQDWSRFWHCMLWTFDLGARLIDGNDLRDGDDHGLDAFDGQVQRDGSFLERSGEILLVGHTLRVGRVVVDDDNGLSVAELWREKLEMENGAKWITFVFGVIRESDIGISGPVHSVHHVGLANVGMDPGRLVLDIGSGVIVGGIVLDCWLVQLDDSDFVLLHTDGRAGWEDSDLWHGGGRRVDWDKKLKTFLKKFEETYLLFWRSVPCSGLYPTWLWRDREEDRSRVGRS